DVYVVVGHLGEMIIDYLEAVHGLGVNVTFIRQRDLLGSGHALLMVEPEIAGPFIMFLGDIFIEPANFSLLVEPVKAGACDGVLAVAEEDDTASLQKNFSVSLNAQGFVTRVVEKPKAAAPGLKGCGVYGFNTAIFAALKRAPASSNGEVGITDGVQSLIELGGRVRTARVSRWDMNVTTSEDLTRCDDLLAAG
ncbi:MAG TPA: sugar phosphate nucleotidyltransferase, partial [Blastocatellia bacterium]|nr:sugar phosphate nucleotidyltransferase [Blastocatellia bacterium]